MPETNVVWSALPGSQSLFLSCPISEILYHGTRGSAKTDAVLMKYAKYVGGGFGEHWRGIIFRQTYKQLEDIIAKTRRWFRPIFPAATYNRSKFTWEWPTGEALLLRHMRDIDDYWNYHGHEYPFIAFEELTNWGTLDCYEAMKACNRSSYPGMPRFYLSTSNPFGKGHAAVKRYFISPAPSGSLIINEQGDARVAIHGSILENTVLQANDPAYIRKLEAITDPNRRKAWRYGSWDITAGGMFDDLWSPGFHLCRPFKIPADWTIDRAHDWGSSKPSATLWFAESNGVPFEEISDEPGREGKATGRTLWFPRGHLFVVDELYTWNGTENEGARLEAKEIARRGKAIETKRGWRTKSGCRVIAGPADASIFTSEPGEKSIGHKFGVEDFSFVPSFKGPGSRINGWQLVRELLANSVVGEGERQEDAGLTIFDRCLQTVRVLPGTPRDSKDPDDVDTDAEEHIQDVIRYKALERRHVTTVTGLRG